MKKLALWSVGLALILNGSAPAAIVYSNTTVDQGTTLSYAPNQYTQIGDQIHLVGTDRFATQATVQFYNDGSAGFFDAVLRFWAVGSPVGGQLGSDIPLTGINAPAPNANFTGFNVTFFFNGFQIPGDDLIFTVEVLNPTAGVDIVGLDNYGPIPTLGSSSSSFSIGRNAGGFEQRAVVDENVFFELQAITVPEPSTIGLVGAAVAGLALLRRRSAR